MAAVILLASLFGKDRAEAVLYSMKDQQSTFYIRLHVFTQTQAICIRQITKKSQESTFSAAVVSGSGYISFPELA